MLVAGIDDPQALVRGFTEMTVYFKGVIAQRREQRGDDLISYLLDAEFEGHRFDEEHVLGTMRLLLIAGIDTTWSAIGSSIWHLATHDGRSPPTGRRARADAHRDRGIPARLRAGDDGARREQGHGVQRLPDKKGEMILLSFPAANRDPEMFPDADKVLIDRKENRHAAFGLGIHRCVGSNLARMEMTVAIAGTARSASREFRLDTTRPTTWSAGTVRGPRLLPLAIG